MARGLPVGCERMRVNRPRTAWLAAAMLATYFQSTSAYIETVTDPVPIRDPKPGDSRRFAYPIPGNISAAAPDMIMWQFSYSISTIPTGETDAYFIADPCVGSVQLFVKQGTIYPSNTSYDFKSDHAGASVKQEVKVVLKYFNYMVGVFAKPGVNFTIQVSSFTPPQPILKDDKFKVGLVQTTKSRDNPTVTLKIFPPKTDSSTTPEQQKEALSKYTYRAFYASARTPGLNFNTVCGIEHFGTPDGDWKEHPEAVAEEGKPTILHTITGKREDGKTPKLINGARYMFNIIVKDDRGYMTCYTPKQSLVQFSEVKGEVDPVLLAVGITVAVLCFCFLAGGFWMSQRMAKAAEYDEFFGGSHAVEMRSQRAKSRGL